MITPHPNLSAVPDPDAASDTDLQRAVQVARANGRHSRMTMVIVGCIFVLQLLSGFQTRHGWPTTVYDIGAVIAVGVCSTVATMLYRG